MAYSMYTFSGGFIAPFVTPQLVWDFRLERVHSINVSGHKYGLTYPGIGWALWRDKKYLPEELVFNINYLGSNQVCIMEFCIWNNSCINKQLYIGIIYFQL